MENTIEVSFWDHFNSPSEAEQPICKAVEDACEEAAGLFIFHVGIGQLPVSKAEAYLARMKDRIMSMLENIGVPRRYRHGLFIPVRGDHSVEFVRFD